MVSYQGTQEQVFQQDAAMLRAPGFEEKIEDGILRMKYTLMDSVTFKKRDLNEILRQVQTMDNERWTNAVRPAAEQVIPDNWFTRNNLTNLTTIPVVIDDIVERDNA